MKDSMIYENNHWGETEQYLSLALAVLKAHLQTLFFKGQTTVYLAVFMDFRSLQEATDSPSYGFQFYLQGL